MTGAARTQLREIDLVERCLEGCELSISEVKARHSLHLEVLLKSSGATDLEASEIIGTLWLDCLVGPISKDPLFRRFNGISHLRNWLSAIAINRWISFKRSQAVRDRALTRGAEEVPGTRSAVQPDLEVATILAQAVRGALDACTAEEVVMLQLVHFYRLSQKEVAALWGWTESKVSRNLQRLQNVIATETLRRVRQVDAYLDLRWEDFLQLCDGQTLFENNA